MLDALKLSKQLGERHKKVAFSHAPLALVTHHCSMTAPWKERVGRLGQAAAGRHRAESRGAVQNVVDEFLGTEVCIHPQLCCGLA